VRAMVGAQRVLIYAAGSRGALAVRELRENPERGMVPVGFLDDDPDKWGRTLLGLPVLGPLAAAKGIAEKKGLTDVLIAHSRTPFPWQLTM
jgi:FlaA1/EpsC-like NDP-sugar epimerase